MGEQTPLLEARGITKRFGEFAANENISLAIRPGERHALLGENGAGKSTLVKMIYGVLQPTAGSLCWRGEKVRIPNPAAARTMGIGMVFQHFSVFDALTVAENIALALPGEKMRGLPDRISRVSETYGLAIEPGRAVHTLSAGEKQRVEIIRCLLQRPKLLIMDEPTSVLTPQETGILFETLMRLSHDGCAILYISHKLDEIRQICESASVLRQGRTVGQCDPRTTPTAEIAAKMVGHEVTGVRRAASNETAGPVRLSIAGLSLPARSQFETSLKSISLDVRGGELLGIAGVAGEGQSELMEALIGERLAARPEIIEIDSRPAGRLSPTGRRMAGAAFVPEDRSGHAAVTEMSLPQNILLSHHRAAGLSRMSWIDFRATREWAKRVRERFDVRAGKDDPKAGSLSGGNLQKFVVGREILREPGILVVSQPTWGVDTGAAAVIRQALMDLSRSGSAVLVISQDLEELFAIADRIAVIHHGRLSPARPVEDLDAEAVGLLMGGAHPGNTTEDAA